MGFFFFVGQDVKHKRETTPRGGDLQANKKIKKVWVGLRKGKKWYKNKVITKPCQGGELYSLFCRIVVTLNRGEEVII